MKIILSDGVKVDALYRNFTIKTDQPPEKKGDDTAPNPFDLLWASVGTCMGYFVQAFCQQRNLPTENIDLLLKMDRDPDTKMVTDVDVQINLPPEIPEKYHKAIVKSADACFVKKHMFTPPEFNIHVNN